MLSIYMRRGCLVLLQQQINKEEEHLRTFERLKEVPKIVNADECEGERSDTSQIELKNSIKLTTLRVRRPKYYFLSYIFIQSEHSYLSSVLFRCIRMCFKSMYTIIIYISGIELLHLNNV